MLTPHTLISRHRLPRFYRVSLTVLWCVPVVLLWSALLGGHGFTRFLFDPRLLLPLLLMALPALHIWRQGVDVYREGMVIRVHLPRAYAYDQLKHWRVKQYPQGSILTINRHDDRTVLCYHTAHLSDWPLLRSTLTAYVDYYSAS